MDQYHKNLTKNTNNEIDIRIDLIESPKVNTTVKENTHNILIDSKSANYRELDDGMLAKLLVEVETYKKNLEELTKTTAIKITEYQDTIYELKKSGGIVMKSPKVLLEKERSIEFLLSNKYNGTIRVISGNNYSHDYKFTDVDNPGFEFPGDGQYAVYLYVNIRDPNTRSINSKFVDLYEIIVI